MHRPVFQSEVDRWMDACFGEDIKGDKLERADRFIEEALELAQTMPGFTASRGTRLSIMSSPALLASVGKKSGA